MAGTANSITSHNSLRGVLNANNVIAGGVGTAFDSTYSIIAETGAQIALSISSTDYKMQATLKDKYGNIIYTSNIIDLPLETMVVNARYDSNTKEVVLILDNGNELRFNVADLVEGLVSTDQLNSVLTDYVKNTDYASDSKGGVIKTGGGYNSYTDYRGVLYAGTRTYTQYGTDSNSSIISKGTLENVITGKELVNKTYVDEADAVFEDKLFGDNNVEGSGTELTINNTAEAPMSLVYKGNTYQDSTTGTQVLDYDNATTTPTATKIDTYGYNVSGTGSWTAAGVYFSLKPNTTYTFKCLFQQKGTQTSRTCVSIREVNGATLSAPSNSNANGHMLVTFTTGTITSMVIYFYSNLTADTLNTSCDFTNIQIVEGTYTETTIPPFEKYTGGIASPNPDYSQDIHAVSGDNSIEVVGKNLFNDTLRQGVTGFDTGLYNADVFNNRATSGANGWTLLKAGTYTINAKTSQNKTLQISSVTFDTNNSFYNISGVSGQWKDLPFTFYTSVDIRYKTNFRYSDNSNILVSEISEIQIERSSQATTYEEYKGASYPINLGDKELCKIGTYQDKIDKSSGKNLYNGELELGSINPANGNLVSDNSKSRSINFVKVKPNTTYSISKNVNSIMWVVGYTSSKIGIVDGGNTPETSGQASALLALGASINSGTFTTTSTTEYIKVYFTTSYSLTTNIMLNEGSTALPYEPYGTGWYLKKEISKVVLDGSENWGNTPTQIGSSSFYRYANSDATNTNIYKANTEYICDKFKYNGTDALVQQNVITNTDGANINRLWITIDTNELAGTTTADFKGWLNLNNVTVYYILATPTYEEITDEILVDQLEAIKLSYENQTNISQTNNDLPFELNISAVSGNLSGIKLLLEAKEDKSNKVTIINEYSTDEQYPTAKCVYELVGNIESLLEILDIGTGAQGGLE